MIGQMQEKKNLAEKSQQWKMLLTTHCSYLQHSCSNHTFILLCTDVTQYYLLVLFCWHYSAVYRLQKFERSLERNSCSYTCDGWSTSETAGPGGTAEIS